MTICDFYISLHSLVTSNLDNKYFFYYIFNFASLINNLFMDFLISLGGKMLFFNKSGKQSVDF